jgi:predicted nucleotidyltransferase
MVDFDRNRLADLCHQHGATRLRLFGSAARGEERPESDIDIIVDFERSVGYLGLIRFENALSEFFGRQVDLVTEPGLSPFIRDSVLASASVIFDAAA